PEDAFQATRPPGFFDAPRGPERANLEILFLAIGRPVGGSMRGRTAPSGLVAACVCALGLSACVATVETRDPRYVYVSGPPPAPLVDTQPPPPATGMFWVAGYWHWNGVRYVWLPGHWERPSAGFVYVAPTYSSVDGRYVYRRGRWEMRAAGDVHTAR